MDCMRSELQSEVLAKHQKVLFLRTVFEITEIENELLEKAHQTFAHELK
jgi:hypothetical protein